MLPTLGISHKVKTPLRPFVIGKLRKRMLQASLLPSLPPLDINDGGGGDCHWTSGGARRRRQEVDGECLPWLTFAQLEHRVHVELMSL